MQPIDLLIRALAHNLRDIQDFGASITDAGAAKRFLTAIFRNHCPLCDAPGCETSGERHTYCGQCHKTSSLTAASAIARTKLSLRLWLAATWHIHVAECTISARGFGRRYGVDKMTAWKLLRQVRLALPYFTLQGDGAVISQVLGNEAPKNRAEVCVALEGNSLVVMDADDVGEVATGGARANPLFLGRLKAWLTTNFHGVSKRYLWLYLAEFADRFCRPHAGPFRRSKA